MFIHKNNRNLKISKVEHVGLKDVFYKERYNIEVYKNGPYYMGSELWGKILVKVINCDTRFEF